MFLCIGCFVAFSRIYNIDIDLSTPFNPTYGTFKGGFWALAYSPDGNTIAGGGGYGIDEQHICLWDVESGQHIKALSGNTNLYNHLAFSPDGEILATSGEVVLFAGVNT